MDEHASEHTFFADVAAEIPDVAAQSTVSRTLLKNDDVRLVVFGFDAGQELSEHTSAYAVVIQILEGDAELRFGDGEIRLASVGTWLYMPPHMPHSILAKTPLKMLLLMLPRAERSA